MPGPDPTNSSRWACNFTGCVKSFARKEHLTRHERTHSAGDKLYVCKVCLQKFNRSDSLQRHLARHGDTFKAGPSSRSKKACISCHKGKIKCDGNDPCSKCHSKGVPCQYERSEQPAPVTSRGASLEEAGSETMSESPITKVQSISPQAIEIVPYFHAAPLDMNLRQREGEIRPGPVIPHPEPTAALPSPKATPKPWDAGGNAVVDWTKITVQKDPSPDCEEAPLDGEDEYWTRDKNRYALSKSLQETYLHFYYAHFHHRWPIIHRTLYRGRAYWLVFKYSMYMMGGWLSGTREGKIYAFEVHDCLMPHISTILGQKSSTDKFQDTLPSSSENLISRAIVLRNILVAVLREVEFFNPSTIYNDEKPGFFIPLHLSQLGERQRLASSLFKLDNYLSLIRCQSSLLMPQDLHFPPPCSYALFNGDGLHMFAERVETEPPSRQRISMSSLLRDNEQGKEIPTDEPTLIEDIQLYLCAIQPRIMLFWNKMRYNSYSENKPSMYSECPMPRLRALKQKLDRISAQLSHNLLEDGPLPLLHYYGYEKPIDVDFQSAPSARAKALLFDAQIMYHLLIMQLDCDIGMLTQIAKDRTSILSIPLPEKHRQQREARASKVATWTETTLARTALCHAAEILVLHEHNHDFDIRTLDPISHVAVTTAALVVWAYCTFSEAGAEQPSSFFAELTKWCGGDDKGREAWIQIGAGCPVKLGGVRLRECNVALLMSRFRAFIPEEWELANSMAPGVFKGVER
ncbi:Krueppel-like factor [Lachnellula suecica]|uniref:Krueppel-like factor n=1 Tax=Lachnellula suecica TaxID=602035 RepID=A0A8T9C2S4_9HELO|nr:Krueppel-like factor [Lachnellula suecica]